MTPVLAVDPGRLAAAGPGLIMLGWADTDEVH